MKALFAALALTVAASSSFAAQREDNYLCKEIKRGNVGRPTKTVVLKKIGLGPVREGQPAAYVLEVWEKGVNHPVLVKKAVVNTEDVMFSFEVKGEAIKGMIYMDEMNEAWIEIGRKNHYLSCDLLSNARR